MNEKTILLGNEAIARGAYEAGVKVSSAYPGTPSTEISENLAKYDAVYTEWLPWRLPLAHRFPARAALLV